LGSWYVADGKEQHRVVLKDKDIDRIHSTARASYSRTAALQVARLSPLRDYALHPPRESVVPALPPTDTTPFTEMDEADAEDVGSAWSYDGTITSTGKRRVSLGARTPR